MNILDVFYYYHALLQQPQLQTGFEPTIFGFQSNRDDHAAEQIISSNTLYKIDCEFLALESVSDQFWSEKIVYQKSFSHSRGAGDD